MEMNYTALNQWHKDRWSTLACLYGAHMREQSDSGQIARSGPFGNLLLFLADLHYEVARVAMLGMRGRL